MNGRYDSYCLHEIDQHLLTLSRSRRSISFAGQYDLDAGDNDFEVRFMPKILQLHAALTALGNYWRESGRSLWKGRTEAKARINFTKTSRCASSPITTEERVRTKTRQWYGRRGPRQRLWGLGLVELPR